MKDEKGTREGKRGRERRGTRRRGGEERVREGEEIPI